MVHLPRHFFASTRDGRARKVCPGGVGFDTSSASGGRGAVLVANSTRPVLHGVSVRVVGTWLGLQISKPDDEHVNTNGEFLLVHVGCHLKQPLA